MGLSSTEHPTPRMEHGEVPVWYLQRIREGARGWQETNPSFALQEFLAELDAAGLKPKVHVTLEATASTADSRGFTAVDRATIADRLGINTKTVTVHWKQARSVGLLISHRRFNNSSIHQLMTKDSWLQPLGELPQVQPLRPHAWTREETAWWTEASKPDLNSLPWSQKECPF